MTTSSNRDWDKRLHWLLFAQDDGPDTPEYTGSLDDAFDLMRRRFPGWWFSIRTTEDGPLVWISLDLNHPTYGHQFPSSWHDFIDPMEDGGPGLAIRFPFGTPPAQCMSIAMANVALGVDQGKAPTQDTDILSKLETRERPFDLSVLPIFQEDAASPAYDAVTYELPVPGAELDREIHEAILGRPFDGTPYSTSIDATLALVEEVLPGWGWRLGECFVSDDILLEPNFSHPEHGEALRAKWGHVRDAVYDGPGIDFSYAPPGRPALGMCAMLSAVDRGLREGRQPDPDTIWEITSQKRLASPTMR